MDQKIKILGFGGSLRKGSYSKTILNTAKELAPEDADIEIFEKIGEFPLFNQDMERDPPEAVKEFKEKIEEADAILISTPEYNYSIPGYLKNAIDWASRPYGDNSFNDKAVAVMSESEGMLGGARAKYALRNTFVFLNMHPLQIPEVIIPFAHKKIKDRKLIDQHTKDKIKELLEALVAWTKRLRG
ncbi:MAG: NAD(P)H-dependent oxidoreductase [Actinobacteria bacterium]|nr:NAD(P)H-dependent oxidoreductase [Actinomycetota bacterium]